MILQHIYIFVLSEDLKTSLRSWNYCIPRLRRDLLLRSKVNTLKPNFVREKEKAAF